jgi:beta-galactosidase
MYADFPKDYPGKKFISTESVSAFESRNFYQMPSDSIRRWPEDWRKPFTNGTDDHLCSSYDNVSAPWGSTHGETWKIMKKHPFLSGQFIWTGFDYLGEPTPYVWPSRSSYFGIVDLAGFPKDAYYLYQSEWTNKPVLHILPHWNWTVGQTIDVWAYTNFDEVELIINGKSQGVKSKQGDDLHLIWQVVYEPGTLKAVGKNKNGNTQEVVINTAGEAVKLKLVPEENSILANGDDFVYASVTVLDKDDNVVPYADNMIQFETSENLEIVGVDNGLQTSLESFKAKQHKAFNSKCMVIVKATGQKGEGWIKAKADGVDESEAKLMIK